MKPPPLRRPRARWPVAAACLAAVTIALSLVGWGAMGAWQAYSDSGTAVAAETVTAVPVTSIHCSGTPTPYSACPDTSGDVSLSWGSVGGSPGYAVFRATSPTGSFRPLATLPSGAVSYTDTSAAHNAQYYYQLLSEATAGWPPGTGIDMALSLPPTSGTDATAGGGAATPLSAANLSAMSVAGDGSAYTTTGPWGGLTALSLATIDAASCASAARCWVGGSTGGGGTGGVWMTGDGGATWTQQTLPGRTGTLLGLTCVSATQCWAVGQGGTILATSDGGATWIAESSGLRGRGAANLNAISCAGATLCWAVGDATARRGRRGGGGGAATILATTDAGATWTAQASGTTRNLLGVSCPTATQCWAVGQGGTILATGDGGTTWVPETSGTGQNLDAVSFVGSQDGWAVGAGGLILVTTDGGTTWTAQASGTTANLLAVTMVSGTTGWAVGAGGTILHTTDGGVTWSAQTSGTTRSINAVGAASTLDAVAGLTSAGFFGGGQSASVLATDDGGITWSLPVTQYVQWSFSPQVVATAPVTSVVVTLVDLASAAPSAGTATSLLVSTDSGATWTSVSIANPTTQSTTQVVDISSLVTTPAQVAGLELRYAVTQAGFFSTPFQSTFDLVHVDIN